MPDQHAAGGIDRSTGCPECGGVFGQHGVGCPNRSAADDQVSLAWAAMREGKRRDALLDILDVCTGWCRKMTKAEALDAIAKIAGRAV